MELADINAANLKPPMTVMTNEMVKKHNVAISLALKNSSLPILRWRDFAKRATTDNDGIHFDQISLNLANEVSIINYIVSCSERYLTFVSFQFLLREVCRFRQPAHHEESVFS